MIVRILASFLAGTGFAVVFSVPARIIPWASSIAALSWFVYELSSLSLGLALSVFLSSLVVGISARVTAKIKNWPLQPLIVVGIVPLVPGASAFYAMQNFMFENLFGAFEFSYMTFFSASGIVIGLVASTSIYTLLERAIWNK